MRQHHRVSDCYDRLKAWDRRGCGNMRIAILKRNLMPVLQPELAVETGHGIPDTVYSLITHPNF